MLPPGSLGVGPLPWLGCHRNPVRRRCRRPGTFLSSSTPAELVELAQYVGVRNHVSSTTAWQESVSALLLDRQVDRNECLGVRTKKGTAKSARIPPVSMSYGRASVGEFPAAFRLSDLKPNPPARETRSVILLV